MIGEVFRWANLTIAFLLELCALCTLGYWGIRTGSGLPTKMLFGIGTPLFAAVLWGLFASPRAPVVEPLVRLGVQIAFFGSAGATLYDTGHRGLAVTFVLSVITNAILMRL